MPVEQREARAVDVVVPTYNNRDIVLKCLAALDDDSIAAVAVVDDVSSDGTLDALAREVPAVRAVALSEHRGLSHALNRGAAQGGAEYLLFLNDDVLVTPGAIGRLVSGLRDRPGAVFAGGRLVDAATGCTQSSYTPRLLPSTRTLVARLIGVERAWRSNPWSGQHLRDPLPDNRLTATRRQPAGACLLVRRSAFERVGGWDERFWFWYEDVDLVARLLPLGHGVWEPRAVFRHLGRQSTRRWDKPTQHARLYHSTLLYVSKHLGGLRRQTVAAVAVGVCLVRVPGYLVRGRWTAARTYLTLARQALAVAVGRDPGPPPRAVLVRRRGADAAPAHR